MKRGRFCDGLILGNLKEAQAGVKVSDLCHKNGISDATYLQVAQ